VDEYRLFVYPVVLGGGGGCSPRGSTSRAWGWSNRSRFAPGSYCWVIAQS